MMIVGCCSSVFFSFRYGSRVSVPDIRLNSALCNYYEKLVSSY
jgi:hypothetical protein